MPSKTSKKKVVAAELPSIPKELIDPLVSGAMTAEAVNAASMAFKKALIKRTLGAELTHHLGSAGVIQIHQMIAAEYRYHLLS